MAALVEVKPSTALEPILSDLREPPSMNEQGHIDSEALIVEVTRYLAAVDAFRTENCEPMWLPELVSIRAAETPGIDSPQELARVRQASSLSRAVR